MNIKSMVMPKIDLNRVGTDGVNHMIHPNLIQSHKQDNGYKDQLDCLEYLDLHFGKIYTDLEKKYMDRIYNIHSGLHRTPNDNFEYLVTILFNIGFTYYLFINIDNPEMNESEIIVETTGRIIRYGLNRVIPNLRFTNLKLIPPGKTFKDLHKFEQDELNNLWEMMRESLAWSNNRLG